jgi:hypothetical protein
MTGTQPSTPVVALRDPTYDVIEPIQAIPELDASTLIALFPVENHVEAHHNALLPNNDNSDAALEQILLDAKNMLGFHSVAKVLVGLASPDERARLVGIAAIALLDALPNTLGPDDVDSLQEYAAYRPWLSRQSFGYSRNTSPVDFIEKEYKYWIDRGLTQAQLRVADPDLIARLDRWPNDSGNALPPGFLSGRRGMLIKLIAEIFPAEIVETAARINDSGRKRDTYIPRGKCLKISL